MRKTIGIGEILCVGLAFGVAGCESPAWTHSLNESFGIHDDASGPRTEEEHRREYNKTHSRKSMRWLLGHCVETGMTYKDVCRVLGEEGERERQDRGLKNGLVNVRIDDEVYAFGPDSDGRVLYLFFRDDRLINFDSSEFR